MCNRNVKIGPCERGLGRPTARGRPVDRRDGAGDAAHLRYKTPQAGRHSARASNFTESKVGLMELDPLYCDGIVQRWEDFTGKTTERRPAG